jgi:hypothetical protein
MLIVDPGSTAKGLLQKIPFTISSIIKNIRKYCHNLAAVEISF